MLRNRVLVFGSLPPVGHDLDLLARPAEAQALRTTLADEGFHNRGVKWVRFADCSVEAIDLIGSESWGLPTPELDRLFAEARPIDGLAQLVHPSPHHALLIIARLSAGESHLRENRRARVAASLQEDPSAWLRAEEMAAAWGADDSLGDLRAAFDSGAQRRKLASTVRRLLRRRPRSGTLITLSGLDGSGKSTQAQALRDTLECLGYPAVVVWTSAPAHGALPAIAGLGRPILHLLARHRSPDEPAGPESAAAVPSERPSAGEAGARTRDPARSLRERSAILTFTWTTLMALLSGWWQSRATRIHLWRGRVVICDRYTLDSKVHMLYAYGESMRYRLQVALIRALSPRPHRAYLLDVSPEVAYARNQEYRLYQVATRARYYRDEYEALGVSRLDGERSPQEVCAEIALDVWRELR